MDAMVSKYCKTCGETKPLSDFYWNKTKGCPCGWCKPCMKTYQTAYQRRREAKDPDYQRRYREQNKDKISQWRKTEWGKYKLSGYYKKRQLKQWGMTLEDLERTFKKQGGACAICRKKFLLNGTDMLDCGHGVHMDHCHKENKFRGILCNNCNTGLGAFKDSPMILKAAATYLQQY